MTTAEWADIVEWVGVRFPNKLWQAEQQVAYFHDLERFDVSDVWAGLFGLYEAGQRFAPNGSQLVQAASREQKRSADADRFPTVVALPASRTEGPTLAERRFGERMSGVELVERIHRESTKCRSASCPWHQVKV